MPAPPPAVPALLGCARLRPGDLARVCQRLRVSLADLDERFGVADVLDELDLQAYLYDVDREPAPPKGPRTVPG